MASTFVITGTRPPSVAGMRSPLTASSKDFGYYTKTNRSTVDETLFHSHHASAVDTSMNFAAPWERKVKGADGKLKKLKRPDRPLLWAPSSTTTTTPNTPRQGRTAIDDDDDHHSIGTIQGIPMKHQYRKIKHTPTFVDESLFGDPLSEPSFKAPWEEKKKVKQVVNWYPMPGEERQPVRRRRRPVTALGLHTTTSTAVPVWKP